MAASGTVVVQWFDPGTWEPGPPLVQGITVQPRGWSWANTVSGRQGNAGEIDSCFSSNFFLFGLTASASCTAANTNRLFIPDTVNSSGRGYVAASIASGPNQGLWYVQSVAASIDLRTQRTRKLRADGDTVSLAGLHPDNLPVQNGCSTYYGGGALTGKNFRDVNINCMANAVDFNRSTNCTWTHEGKHKDSVVVAARRAVNDIPKIFDTKVAASANALHADLKFTYDEVNFRLLLKADSAHLSMVPDTTRLWLRQPSQNWRRDTLYTIC